jgi:glycine betaine/proline transport system substrate-binding protein
MKTLLGAALGAFAILGMAAGSGHTQETIKMGTMSWEDLASITGITKKVLEDAGYTVEVTSFSEWGIAYAALVKGDIQVLASLTDYVAQDYWDRNKNRLEKISPVSHGLYQAFAVPTYVTIDSVEQLNEAADKFNNKIIGVEPGSGLMREATDAVSEYGLKLQVVEGSTAGMTAALKSAYDRQEWIAVTLWEPSWMVKKFDTKYLQDPKGVFPPPQTYYWIGQEGFSEEYPHAREVMASVYVPIADITAINAELSDGKSMEQAVADWIGSHADLIERWENIKKD